MTLPKTSTKGITIRFSHQYFKLGGDKQAKLLAVFNTHYDQLGKDFIEFDTKYFDGFEVGDDGTPQGEKIGYYPLPHTDLLVLLLQDSSGLFTTVRSKRGRGGLDKEKYYREHIGEQVNILIEEKE